MWSNSDEVACHVRRYTKSELRRKAEKAGFEVMRMTSFVSLLFPLMFISRLQNRISKEGYDPCKELRINPMLNSSFEFILNIENLLIKTGVSFPFGGSLLLVGRKV